MSYTPSSPALPRCTHGWRWPHCAPQWATAPRWARWLWPKGWRWSRRLVKTRNIGKITLQYTVLSGYRTVQRVHHPILGMMATVADVHRNFGWKVWVPLFGPKFYSISRIQLQYIPYQYWKFSASVTHTPVWMLNLTISTFGLKMLEFLEKGMPSVKTAQ